MSAFAVTCGTAVYVLARADMHEQIPCIYPSCGKLGKWGKSRDWLVSGSLVACIRREICTNKQWKGGEINNQIRVTRKRCLYTSTCIICNPQTKLYTFRGCINNNNCATNRPTVGTSHLVWLEQLIHLQITLILQNNFRLKTLSN